jgi:hypothetical protein
MRRCPEYFSGFSFSVFFFCFLGFMGILSKKDDKHINDPLKRTKTITHQALLCQKIKVPGRCRPNHRDSPETPPDPSFHFTWNSQFRGIRSGKSGSLDALRDLVGGASTHG